MTKKQLEKLSREQLLDLSMKQRKAVDAIRGYVMDKCKSCKYFSEDLSTGTCECLRIEHLNSVEVENYVEATTENCSQFEENDGEDRYYAELGAFND